VGGWLLPVSLPTLPVPSTATTCQDGSAVIPHCVGCPTLHKARMKHFCGLGMLRTGAGVVTTIMLALPSSNISLNRRSQHELPNQHCDGGALPNRAHPGWHVKLHMQILVQCTIFYQSRFPKTYHTSVPKRHTLLTRSSPIAYAERLSLQTPHSRRAQPQ
jgi:hypothetical protein